MSGEVVPEIRVVRCPKCKLLLPEPPGCDLYRCGGCGITLEAKRVAVKSKSSIQETDSAPRNTLDLVSKDNQFGDRKHLVPPREDDLKAKATTSSGECYLYENVGRGQNENGEYSGSQLVPCNVSDEELESELDIYKLSLRRHRGFNKGSSNKTTYCEIEEINDEDLLFEGSKEELICASDENGNNDKSSLIGVTSEMEITESDLEGAEELNNGNSLPEGAEKEIILDQMEKMPIKTRSRTRVKFMCTDGEDPNNDQSAIEDAKSEVDSTESTSTPERSSTDKGSILHVLLIILKKDQLNKSRYMGGETNGRLSKITLGVMEDVIMESGAKGIIHTQGYLIQLRPTAMHTMLIILVSTAFPISQQICLHMLISRMKIFRSYPGQDCCSSHHSYPSNPQWFTVSKLPVYGRENKSDDQRHRAPELPADFFFSKGHVINPPSSELNDQSEVIGSSFLPSASHANYYQYSYTDPISYYDDYGVSVSKSYSSEGDPVSMTQFHALWQ
ncbi:hypothetical protein SESBI_39928 [Sesbania bispinosa]|nr:hypothetical protein SESBI_39928 [Sesbania bispinosa]